MKEESELEKLLKELKNIKNEQKSVPNNSDTWSKIAHKDWEGAGFASEDEAKAWLADNPYLSLCN
jgi:hypothetical protein